VPDNSVHEFAVIGHGLKSLSFMTYKASTSSMKAAPHGEGVARLNSSDGARFLRRTRCVSSQFFSKILFAGGFCDATDRVGWFELIRKAVGSIPNGTEPVTLSTDGSLAGTVNPRRSFATG
jgi:hypothetical protein